MEKCTWLLTQSQGDARGAVSFQDLYYINLFSLTMTRSQKQDRDLVFINTGTEDLHKPLGLGSIFNRPSPPESLFPGMC